MKKILLAFFTVIALTSYGQLYENNFNNGELNGMTVVDRDGQTIASNIASRFTDGWTVMVWEEGATDYFAASTSWYSPAGKADDWLISPNLTVPADSDFSLIFDARSPDENYRDGYEVRVSTTDAKPESFTELLLTVDAENPDWTKRRVSLADYAGKNIHFAIINNSTDKFVLWVDNISVREIPKNELTVLPSTKNIYVEKGTPQKPSVTIYNNGLETITSVDLEVSVDGNTTTETVTGLSIPTFESAVVNTTKAIELSEARKYDVTVKASKPNGQDDNLEDNQDKLPFVVVTEKVERVAVVEEGTGTWCGFCPRGAVALKLLDAKYGDKIISIAAHLGNDQKPDPMEIPDYIPFLGFSGFPSAHLNREVRGIDPSQIDENMETILNGISPVAVDATVDFDKDSRKATITSSIKSLTTLSEADMKVAVVIIENGVTGTTDGYSQANNYAGGQNGTMGGYENLPNPVPAADMVYDHVARALPAGAGGTADAIAKNIEAGKSYDHSFEYTVPENFDYKNMYAVIMVLDKSGAILNATKKSIRNTVSVFNTPDVIEARIYPNPAIDKAIIAMNIASSGDAKVSILDITGKTIQTTTFENLQQGNVELPLDFSGLNAGTYIVKVDSKDGMARKLVTVK